MTCRSIAALLLCLTLGAAAGAQEPIITMTPPEGEAERALATADTAALERLAIDAREPADQALLAAYAARVRGDLTASDAQALLCSDLARRDIPRLYEREAKCRSLFAGNALIRGDAVEWVRRVRSALTAIEDHAREEAHSAFPGKFIANARVGLPGLWSLPTLANVTPVYRMGAGSKTLERVPYQAEGRNEAGVPRGPYSVRATANGVEADFVFDTGATISLVGGTLAARLGLDQDDGGSGVVQMDLHLQGKSVKARLATLDRIQIGAFEARHSTILISTDPEMPNVIGLNLMHNMGPLRISETALELGASASCDGRLLLATDTAGLQQFVIAPVDVGGSAVMAHIDTGQPALLFQFDQPRVAPWEAEFQGVTVNGQHGHVSNGPRTSRYGTLHNVGAGILAGSDLFLDVGSSHLCFEPRRGS